MTATPGEFFPVALLAGRQFIVENDDVELLLLRPRHDFLRLARADEIARMLLAMMHEHAVDDRHAQSVHEFLEFFEQAGRFGACVGLGVSADEQRAFRHFCSLFDIKHEVAKLLA